jgi:exo-beta-1,3-glucanase (GH17 family)
MYKLCILFIFVIVLFLCGCKKDNGGENITQPPTTEYKLHGINFGPYTEIGQNPDSRTIIGEAQIKKLLSIIQNKTEWVRTFSTLDSLENIGRIAHEMGFKTAIGAWLNSNLSDNEIQIKNLITIGKAGQADMLIVGSETLLRNELSETQLIEYINRVKNAVPGIKVTTADVYGTLLDHPKVVEASDVVFVNYYPFWEAVKLETAILNLNYFHKKILAKFPGKEVIVSETGWPSAGEAVGDAEPSLQNASFYFLNFISWARENNVSYFYFEAFDEPWKSATEGLRGASWGIWDKDRKLKEDFQLVFNSKTIKSNWDNDSLPGGEGVPTIEFTYVPPYGKNENIKGQVWHLKIINYNVVVYIKVNNGWWIKPTLANPVTTIRVDGSWSCNYATGGNDIKATEIAAYVIPTNYSPPMVTGGSLPVALENNCVAKVVVTRTPTK